MSEPEDDEQFAQLVESWREDLGPDKHEGIGLLWKEGGLEALFELMRVEFPRVAAALGRQLAAIEPEDLFGGTHLSRFLSAMSAPTAAERERLLDEQDFGQPFPWSEALAMLDPPMPTKFQQRIEAWLDRARAIERRCDGIVEPSTIKPGSKVTHAVFGEGVVTAIQDSTVTVMFSTGEKKLKLDRVALVDA